jgi:transcription elongation factor Elf1
MANFYCKWCGVKHSSISTLTANFCSKNPEGKKHTLYEGTEKTKYNCKFCGNSNSSMATLTANFCSKSPSKKHQPAL